MTEDGKVYGVGKNDRLQLGLEKKMKDERDEILEIFGLPQVIDGFNEYETNEESKGDYYNERIVQISAGKFHSIFLSDKGNVYALGNNRFGQIGFSNFLYKEAEKPRKIDTGGVKITHISAGHHHNLLIDEEGKLYGFGSDSIGQLLARTEQNNPGYLNT